MLCSVCFCVNWLIVLIIVVVCIFVFCVDGYLCVIGGEELGVILFIDIVNMMVI